MKIIYTLLILLFVIYFFAYYTNKNKIELFNSNTKFKFLYQNEDDLEDNFGDIITPPKSKIKEYKEGFLINQNIENFTQEQSVKLLPKIYTPRFVWTYWENKKERNEPYSHIKLCFQTMKKHYAKYNFKILNELTIKNYLPNLREDLNNLMIAQKVDYYRVALLEKYGGVWIDADTIVLKDLEEVFDKLDNGYDFVGFGCTGLKCFNGSPYPSNGVMASRPNGLLMSSCLKKLNQMLDTNNKNYEYFDLGKNTIWKCKNELKNYNYYHFPSEYDGSRDKEGNWIHSPNHLSKTPTELLDLNKAFFILLANYELANDEENKWFLNFTPEQILYGEFWISDLYRKALK